MRAAQNFKLNIITIKDVTAVPHNGCRPQKTSSLIKIWLIKISIYKIVC